MLRTEPHPRLFFLQGSLLMARLLGYPLLLTLTFLAPASLADGGGRDPGFMVVTGGIPDPSQVPDPDYARSYGPAVWALVADFGAHYLVRGRPLKIYEGSWEDWRAVVISKWAERRTGSAFWYSDAYQNDVKPRRKNAGEYLVGMFDKIAGETQSPRWADAPDSCSEPMLTFGEFNIRDADRFERYAQAVSDSGLVEQYGGIPLVFGRTIELLEGEWPESYGVIVTQWPCQEAFEKLYYSNIYQSELKPLRDGAIDMDLILLKPGRPETSGQP